MKKLGFLSELIGLAQTPPATGRKVPARSTLLSVGGGVLVVWAPEPDCLGLDPDPNTN